MEPPVDTGNIELVWGQVNKLYHSQNPAEKAAADEWLRKHQVRSFVIGNMFKNLISTWP
jgi:hypothetical protein